METKRGRLGVAELAATTNTSVYAVTDGNDATVNVRISNLAGAAEKALVNVAVVDGAVGDIADEDYILRGFVMKLGDVKVIEDIMLSANECIVVYSSVAGVTVRVDGIEEEAATEAIGIKKITSQALAFGDFTDNDNTTGYIDFTTDDLPVGAIVVGWKATVTAGFTGDTTAVLQVGIEGDVDAFSADVAQSCLAAGVVGSGALAAAAATPIATAATPRVTVTGGADFTSVAAGSMVVDIYYIDTAADNARASQETFDIQKLTSQALGYASFTDGTGTSGYIDFTTGVLPAGAVVLGWKATVSEGFANDTSAAVIVGVSGDTDAFSADTAQSCLAAGVVGAAALAAEAATPIAAAVTPRVTVTGGADFTSINAGAMVVDVYYFMAE